MGCASVKENLAPTIKPKHIQTNGIIMGRISLYDSQKNAHFGHGITGYSICFGMKAVFPSGEKSYNMLLRNTDDGYFALSVPSGDYTLCSVQFTPGLVRPMIEYMEVSRLNFNRIAVKQGEIVYVGDFYFEITGKGYLEDVKDAAIQPPELLKPFEISSALLGMGDCRLKTTISDKYEAAVSHFQGHNKFNAETYRKELLIFSS